MRHSVYAWFTLSAMRGAISSVEALNLTAIYGPGFSDSAQILDASEPGFMEITPRWTQYRPPTYYGAIIPATEADIQHIVRTSVEHDIPFLATGGGHGLTTTLGQFSGITIELSQFNIVKLDKETGQITLGGGTRYSDIYEPIFNAGKMMGLGKTPCIGAVGATLGGGAGIGQGIYGLGLDALLSVRLITATGDIVVASRTENQDLFWAIRGAGASFGIVISATFQLHDAVNAGIVALTMFTYSPEQNRSVWEALQSYDENIPDELSFNLAAVVNATTREAFIVAESEYHGPPAEAERFLQPFIEIGPISVQSTTLPWTQIYDTVHSTNHRLCTPGQYLNEYTIALKRTDVDAFTAYYNELYALWVREERYEGDWIIARSPTRVMRLVSDEETVFPHRHAITHLLFGNYYSNPSLDSTINAWMRNVRARFQATSGYDKLHAYTNFAQGDEGPGAWYGSANLKRLRALKCKWDPDGVFNNFNPVLL
ncbi:hypothetical protein BDW60DRAFT_195843 [Aspergillus nidulans var. acristatus]